MRTLRTAIAVLSLIGASVLFGGAAQAMPIGQLQVDQSAGVEQARLVCTRWGRCWREPSFRAYGFYRPGPVYVHPRWGWRHRWHHHRHFW